MKNTLNHLSRDFGSVRLGESRLVFVGGETPSPTGHETAEVQKLRERNVSGIREAFEAQKSKKEAMEAQLRKALQSEVGVDYPEDQFRAENLATMEEEISKDGKLSEATQTLIQDKVELINSWLKGTVKGMILDSTNENEHPEDAAVKKTIRDLLEKQYEEQLIAFEKSRKEFEVAAQRTFEEYTKRAEGYISTLNASEDLRGNPNFTQLAGAYNGAVEGLIRSNPDYAVFRESKGNVESNGVAKEYRQLFLSLLYTETGEFKNGFAFGPGFGENPDENMRKFPDLFQIWVERNGGKKPFEDRAVSANKVESLKKSLPALSKKLSAAVNNLPLPDLKKNPKDVDVAEKNIADITAFLANHTDRHNNKALGALEGNYEKDHQALQAMLTLATEQRLWASLNLRVEELKNGFKGSVLSKETQTQDVVEMCLIKFKKAQEITEGLWKDAKLSETYNPEVKRMLIVQIYKNGVSGLGWNKDGTPEFFNNYSVYYSSTLRAIMESPYFNQNFSQKLSNDQIDFLAIAVKNGLAKGRFDEFVKNQGQEKAFREPGMNDYLEAEDKFQESPQFLRDMLEAKLNGGDVAAALAAMPEDYRKLFDNKGEVKSFVSELKSAINNQGAYGHNQLLALEGEYGEPIAANPEMQTQILARIVAVEKAVSGLKTKEEKKKIFEVWLNGKDPSLQNRARDYAKNRAEFGKAPAEFEAIKGYLKDPKSAESVAWLKSAKEGQGVEQARRLNDSHSVDIVYSAMDLHSHSVERQMTDLMDIELRGVYQNYLSETGPQGELTKNPKLKTSNWIELFESHNKGDRKLLIDFLKKIIPQGKEGGKEDFIFMLETMGDEDLMSQIGRKDIQKNDPKVVALSVLGLIKAQIEKEDVNVGKTKPKEQEYDARLDGKNLSDYVSNGLKTIWQMVTNGKPAERIAGIAMLIMGYKAGRKAFSDDPGVGGNLLKGGLMLLVGDHVSKRLFGKGFGEMINVHSIANAYEGTDVAALVKHSKKIAESEEIGGISINEEQEHEALRQMNKVPFNKLVDWYKSVELNKGSLKPGKGQPDLFKKLRPGINTDAIYEHGRKPNIDPDLMGRAAVYKMMRGLFDYMGNQAGQSENAAEYGLRAAEARWVQPLAPQGTAEVAGRRYTTWMPTEAFIGKYKGKPDTLDFETVMGVEVRLEDAQATIGDNWMDRLSNTANEGWKAASDFMRVEILAPTKAKIGEYMDKTRYEWGPEAKKWIGDLADSGATKAYFAKERVVLEYKAHSLEAGRLIDKHIELLKQGAKLPFQLILAVDEAVVDFGNTSLNKLQGILYVKYGSEIPIPLIDRPLDATITSKDAFRSYFGKEYATQFANAINSPEKLYIDETGVSPTMEQNIRDLVKQWQDALPMADRNPTEAEKMITDQLGQSKLGPIAYYVAEVGVNEVPQQLRSNPYEATLWMRTKAEEKARAELVQKLQAQGKDISKYDESYFKDYLYAITNVSQVGSAGPGRPEKVHVFYRMPLAESMEVFRKEKGTWMDSNDPRNLKDNPPFLADSKKSLITNLLDAYGKNLEALKPLAAIVGIPTAELVRLVTGISAAIRDGIDARKHPKIRDFLSNFTLSEDQKIKIDTNLGTAAFGMWALSAKYGSGEAVDKSGRVIGRVTEDQANANRRLFLNPEEAETPTPATPPRTRPRARPRTGAAPRANPR